MVFPVITEGASLSEAQRASVDPTKKRALIAVSDRMLIEVLLQSELFMACGTAVLASLRVHKGVMSSERKEAADRFSAAR